MEAVKEKNVAFLSYRVLASGRGNSYRVIVDTIILSLTLPAFDMDFRISFLYRLRPKVIF